MEPEQKEFTKFHLWLTIGGVFLILAAFVNFEQVDVFGVSPTGYVVSENYGNHAADYLQSDVDVSYFHQCMDDCYGYCAQEKIKDCEGFCQRVC